MGLTRLTRLAGLVGLALLAGGCVEKNPAHKVIFLDGAGHVGAGNSVRSGLRGAGYNGDFDVFHWQSGLLWGVDHLIAARSDSNARRLAEEIELHQRTYPTGYLAVMGLSSGTSVVLHALELLPDDISVDSVVLFQSSVSATRNLAPAMRHVKNKLYATCSQKDRILGAILATADGGPMPPAGRIGFRVPLGLPRAEREPYLRVVNLPWRHKYQKFGWGGGHVSSTRAKFVKKVIGPRILSDEQPSAQRPGDVHAQQRPTLVDPMLTAR